MLYFDYNYKKGTVKGKPKLRQVDLCEMGEHRSGLCEHQHDTDNRYAHLYRMAKRMAEGRSGSWPVGYAIVSCQHLEYFSHGPTNKVLDTGGGAYKLAHVTAALLAGLPVYTTRKEGELTRAVGDFAYTIAVGVPELAMPLFFGAASAKHELEQTYIAMSLMAVQQQDDTDYEIGPDWTPKSSRSVRFVLRSKNAPADE